MRKRSDGMCMNGHSMEDSYLRKTGERDCNTCRRESQRKFRDKRKKQAEEAVGAIELKWQTYEDKRIGDLT